LHYKEFEKRRKVELMRNVIGRLPGVEEGIAAGEMHGV